MSSRRSLARTVPEHNRSAVEHLRPAGAHRIRPARRHQTRSLWPRAWELRTNLSAYDALYVALAEQLDAPLVTADARLARAPGLRCVVELAET